jgi:SagB-type dehydrogenase family enzyme
VVVAGAATGGWLFGGRLHARAQDETAAKQDNTPVDKLSGKTIRLPEPSQKGTTSVEEAIQARRSRREYRNGHVTASALSQLLWCAQGITKREGKRGFRAAPSAGALYPMDVFVVLPAGVFQYRPSDHLLEQVATGDRRKQLQSACLAQKMVTAASVNFVITATYETCAAKYGNLADKAYGRKTGESAERYCIIESGCISENIHIQCESLKLGTVIIGAFVDSNVSACLSLPPQCKPLVVMPVGLI